MDIVSHTHSISQVFSGLTFHIDFYQREYKWEKKQVQVLLDDIFYRFDLEYPTHRHLAPSQVNVNKYSSYYLNTYITTITPEDGLVYIVDGQQRLTTLTLILLKLYKAYEYRGLDTAWIKGLIAGAGPDGYSFWLGSGKRAETMKALFEGKPPTVEPGNVTAAKMVENFGIISQFIDEHLLAESLPDIGHRLHTFGLYFGLRLFLTNLNIGQTDVPMVFEALNDRGMSLLPHEILKGKLLGQLDKREVPKYADQWEKVISELERNGKGEPDRFLRAYLRARYASSQDKATQDFSETTYHRAVLQDEYNESLHFRHDVTKDNLVHIKHFIEHELPYYSRLYQAISFNVPDEPAAGCRKYIALNGQRGDLLLLVLAVCELNDPDETEKVATLARELDRYYALTTLCKVYSDDSFRSMVYRLRALLAGKPATAYRATFDEERFKRQPLFEEPVELYTYPIFALQGYHTLKTKFIRYFFARVEQYLATALQDEMSDTLYNLAENTGYVNGYHVEHILADNEENRQLFGNDEQRFYWERNRLGGLLLLRGHHNQSSSNEPYEDKLKTYQGTLLWNQSLTLGFYHAKPNHKRFAGNTGMPLQAETAFDADTLERRSKLLFAVTQLIWT
jgi:hypothetical protein